MAKVLCIEDEATIRLLIAEALSEAGHDVLEAADGETGLQAVLQHRPDIVICDSLMPAMTGIELCGEIRNLHPQLGTLPFILLSAHANKSKIEDGLALGATAYLTKPVDLDHLVDIVEQALDGRCDPVTANSDGGIAG